MTQHTARWELPNGDSLTINTTLTIACACAGGCGRTFEHIAHRTGLCWCLPCWLVEYQRSRAAVD